MAVLTKEQLLEAVRDRVGDDTSDEALAFIADITDTIADYENKSKPDSEDWKQKYEDNDKKWRQKYRDRFFSGGSDDGDNDEPDSEPSKKLTFESLFKEGK